MRLTARQLRKLTAAERAAYDRLVFSTSRPAERARLKMTLRRRRTREETLALVAELLDAGRTRLEVAAELHVDPGYIDRLLKASPTAENDPENPRVSSGVLGLTDGGQVIAHSARSTAEKRAHVYGGDPFAYDFGAALEAVPA